MNIEDLISQYIDGELSSEAEAELHHRLSVSPDDRRLFREHVELKEAARSRKLQHHPTQAMEMALFARLAAEDQEEIPDMLPMAASAEAVPELHTLEPAAALRPLEPAAVPAPRSMASDAPAVRFERTAARRRRLVPLLLPFVLGIIAMGVIWQLFPGSSDRAGEIAVNSSESSSQSAQAPAVVEDDIAAMQAEPVSPEASLSNPLSDPGVMSDAGPTYSDRTDDGRGPGSAASRSQQLPSGNASDGSIGGSGSAMGSGAQNRMSSPPAPPADMKMGDDAAGYRSSERGTVPPDRNEMDVQSADGSDDFSPRLANPTTPIESPRQREMAATPIEQDTEGIRSPPPASTNTARQSAESREETQRSARSQVGSEKSSPPPAVAPTAPPAGMISQLGDAYFDSDRATLKSASKQSLDLLTDLLKSYPKMRIEIQGHTDSDGSNVRNSRLSEDRARSVMSYLRQRGIPAERMEIRGYGPDSPLAPNTTVEGRKLNRRVVVVVKDYAYTR